mmetsp:Transcript_26241/g.66648  ORF Transcript_26241/g.66648 Transcript_26241/m.66648 type:complete len:647 (+) Transcript_26241:129-2069(+)
MDLIAETANAGAKKAKDAELAKAMFEGTQQYRKKLKLPELGEFGEHCKEEACSESFYTFMEHKVGRHYFCRFVQDVHPVHGNFLLQCGRYRATVHEKRPIAQELVDSFVNVISEIWSGEDPDTIIEAYKENPGKKVPPSGKKTTRQNAKAGKLNEAKSVQEHTVGRLGRGTPPDLVDEMFNMLKDDLDVYWPEFKKSKWMEQYARARQMEKLTVSEDDFHQFRVLGVGGFGAVHAAVKRDTGILLAIKRMDKKLIKHKNRYKSCYTEQSCLQALTSDFVCGLHYSYQTKDDVCLVLDLLHGGTLSFLLHQKKKVSERYVCFFTACIVMAYEALHSKGYVYRDMKPANVLIKDNGYAVLIDFGLAAKVETALKGKCGTRGYWSPEMVKGDQYLYSGDWWSLGVTMIELLTGKKPFKKKFQKYKNTDDKVKIVKSGSVEDEIEEKRKALMSRTPVTLERLLDWLKAKQAAKAAAEEEEMESLRKSYAKTGKAAGVTGKQLFSIDASLFVDDAAANDVHHDALAPPSDDEAEGEGGEDAGQVTSASLAQTFTPIAMGDIAAPPPPEPDPEPEPALPPPPPAAPQSAGSGAADASSSGAEPEYGLNYDAAGAAASSDGEGGSASAAVADLAGVDESLFLDEDLPDDDDLE